MKLNFNQPIVHLFKVNLQQWIILCSWSMELVPCVTLGFGAWWSAVSPTGETPLPVLVYTFMVMSYQKRATYILVFFSGRLPECVTEAAAQSL